MRPCAAWGLTLADLTSDDCARCQEVARVARADGYEVIRYPSAAVGGIGERHEPAATLAIFADGLRPGSAVRVVRSEPLPLDDA